MPTTPSTDIEVAQKAMVLIGLEPLTSFTDATDEALVANTIYEDVVADCPVSITGTCNRSEDAISLDRCSVDR